MLFARNGGFCYQRTLWYHCLKSFYPEALDFINTWHAVAHNYPNMWFLNNEIWSIPVQYRWIEKLIGIMTAIVLDMGHLVSLATIYELAILTWYLLYVLLVKCLWLDCCWKSIFQWKFSIKRFALQVWTNGSCVGKFLSEICTRHQIKFALISVAVFVGLGRVCHLLYTNLHLFFSILYLFLCRHFE